MISEFWQAGKLIESIDIGTEEYRPEGVVVLHRARVDACSNYRTDDVTRKILPLTCGRSSLSPTPPT